MTWKERTCIHGRRESCPLWRRSPIVARVGCHAIFDLNPGVRHSLGVPWGPGVRSPRGGRRRRFRRVGHTPASQAQWTSPAQA